MAFHAQQAAEMAIKAVYQKKRAVFEFTHDLNQLLKGLRAGGMHVPHELEAADLLTKYATKARYPGLIPHVTEVEFRSALVIAGEVIQWAEGAGQTGPDS
jgi:HEPN domain-containing protein